jgi:hypothetical protein
MEEKIKNAIEQYQCSGCMNGGDISCFQSYGAGAGCGKHYTGTIIIPIGKIFPGMPKGFNRLGSYANMKPRIYEQWKAEDDHYNTWNVPVWKYLDPETNYTFIRGICPRTTQPFIDIFLENCMDKINCLEITEEIHKFMD